MSGVVYPKNDFTQMIEAVSRRNVAGGGIPNLPGEPLPNVRSAGLGQPVENDPTNQPLSAQEIMELNAAAAAAGVKDERIGTADAEPVGGYGSLEEAMAAGMPVNAPSVVAAEVVRQRQPRASVVQTVVQPRLPNFRNVQGIDLITGVVYVDDMEFKIPAGDLASFRQYVVEIAKNEIMKQLEEATSMFARGAEATSGGEATG